MLRASLTIFLVLTAVAFAGCAAAPTGGPDDDVDRGTGNQSAPKPKAVVMRDQHAPDIPTADNPFVASFDVEAPYDQLVILLHASGVGQYRLTVTGPDGASLYDTGDVPSASEPDSHSHTAQGVRVATVEGAHTAEVSFAGGITYHLTIFASKAGADADKPHDH